MPFASISELPESVRRRLDPDQQRTFVRVFNATFERNGGTEAQREAAAFRFANAAVRRMNKGIDLEKRVAVEKVDEEQRMVWGWAYVCKDDSGQQVVDHSGDIVELSDVHEAAHGFMRDSRAGGVMHEGLGGYVSESLVVTDAVASELGMTTQKRGWFVGFKVTDDSAWEGVKAGKFRAFSIGGTADVEDLDGAAA